MSSKDKLLSPMISAAIVLVVLTNFCIVQVLNGAGESASTLLRLIWPIAVPSTVAVILIMSALYQTLQELVAELEQSRQMAVTEAQHDALTGLANKRLLQDRVEQAIGRHRRMGERFAVLLMDLDHFKRANDSHGHPSGDRILKDVAARLQQLVRETDTVARFGGDEFFILQTDVQSERDVRTLCSRIIAAMHEPFAVPERQVCLSASIGAVLTGENLEDSSDYVRAADIALYEAKSAGKNCFRLYTDELDAELRRRDALGADLLQAIGNEENISVKFQPQLDGSGNVIGAEALFRWQHPIFGTVSPIEAISIAEDERSIDALGEFVIRQATAFAKEWPQLFVAVNLSPAQFSHPQGLADALNRIVTTEGVSPQQIELEITEQLFVREPAGCEEQVNRLRSFGFRIVLDDFGTGYSSLSHLRRFKLDRLKLDRSFADTAELHDSVAVIRGAVSLAHSLHMEVVAEGIATEMQERIALEAGCDAVQGNRYAAPLTLDEFRKYMNSRVPAPNRRAAG